MRKFLNKSFITILTLVMSLVVYSQPFDAPSDIPKFQSFLSGCKLQAPTSSTIATQSTLNDGYSSNQFYVVETDKIAFNQTGESMRTELRHETNWTLSEGDRSFHGSLKLVEQTCDQVTVVQIHDDANAGNGPNKPLLRIYSHLTRSPANHIWAAIKTDAGGVNTKHVDLGSAPTDYFDWDVILENGVLIIKIDDVEKANEDVSFWTFPSYWKAGVYLQDDGEATAFFDQLYLDDEPFIEEPEEVLSTKEELPGGINVYPNPSSSFVTIDLLNDDFLGGSLSLMTVSGRVLKDTSIVSRKMDLNMGGEEGLYIVKIEKGDLSETIRIIKKSD